MPVGTSGNHWKFFLANKLFKSQSHALSITFNNAAKTLVRGAGSFITDGFAVGDIIYTNSANAANQGPFLVSAVGALTITVLTTAGAVHTNNRGGDYLAWDCTGECIADEKRVCFQ